MHRCPELSKLPKPSALTSIKFRRQSPGSISKLLIPRTRPDTSALLDPTHPAAALPRTHFPASRNALLGIRAFPTALLDTPRPAWPAPFNATPLARTRQLPMSLFVVATKRATSKKAVVRNKLVSRLKTALTLVVVRGADAAADGRLVLREREAVEEGRGWVMPGWSYVFYPTLEVYRAPYAVLVQTLRQALRAVNERGKAMDARWVAGRRGSLARGRSLRVVDGGDVDSVVEEELERAMGHTQDRDLVDMVDEVEAGSQRAMRAAKKTPASDRTVYQRVQTTDGVMGDQGALHATRPPVGSTADASGKVTGMLFKKPIIIKPALPHTKGNAV